MRMKDIYLPSDHYKIYGEYVPYEDEHIEEWTDDNGTSHAEIICNKCGETRYFKERSPMARAVIWRAVRQEGTSFNGCSCQRATKGKAQRRRDDFNSTPEHMIAENGERILVRKNRDFLAEYMFDWQRNMVAQNSHIPQDIVTARINDRSFMKKGFSYLARTELRRIAQEALANGIVDCDGLYLTGTGKCEKTRALFALRNVMLEGTINAVFTNVDQIISLIQTNSMYIGTLLSAECLLIDDIGKRNLSRIGTDCVVNFINTLRIDSNHNCIFAGIPLDELRNANTELYMAVSKRVTNELCLTATGNEDTWINNVPF